MNEVRAEVCILLPVFNGAAYLAEQLRSLLAQTHGDWHCLIRDDGSSDASCSIIDRFCAEYPRRFRRIADDWGNLGVVGCLNALSRHAHAPYFALCDQDDVWQPDKLALCLHAIDRIEEGGSVATLTVSDLAVVDADLRPISPSFWRQTGHIRHVADLACLPVFNAFPGCAMVGNRALFEAAFPVPPAAPMHDYWIALAAKYGGRVAVLEERLVLYRQHGRNQCGVGEVPSLAHRLARRLTALPAFFEQGRRLRRMRLELLTLLRERLPVMTAGASYAEALTAEQGGLLARWAFLRRHGIPPSRAFVYWLA